LPIGSHGEKLLSPQSTQFARVPDGYWDRVFHHEWQMGRMRTLEGKKLLLTGATGGIGRAMAHRFAEQGMALYLTDLDAEALADLAAELEPLGSEVRTLAVDLSQTEAVTRIVEAVTRDWGSLDVLVNNAGVCYYGSTLRMEPGQWEWLLNINLLAPIRLTQALLPLLLERPEAHILNVSSIYGHVALGRSTAYHTSKFGLIGLSEALRAEFNRDGLGVTALCPGFVKTDFFKHMAVGNRSKSAPTPPQWLCVSPDDVARKAVWSIRRNKRVAFVGLLAFALYGLRRVAPGLIDWIYSLSRSRKKKQAQAVSPPAVEISTRHAA
jgi:short-subunit dehydrogenase